jgi:hypothetical protein
MYAWGNRQRGRQTERDRERQTGK